jgi:hypothetical protein
MSAGNDCHIYRYARCIFFVFNYYIWHICCNFLSVHNNNNNNNNYYYYYYTDEYMYRAAILNLPGQVQWEMTMYGLPYVHHVVSLCINKSR